MYIQMHSSIFTFTCTYTGALGEILSAAEFMDRQSMDLVLTEHAAWTKDPLPDSNTCPFYFLIETSGSNLDHDQAKLETCVETLLTQGIVSDGVLAQDQAQSRSLFQLREEVAVAITSTKGVVYKYDVSLPLSRYYELVEVVRDRLKAVSPEVTVVGYGHLGDCNLHLNVAIPGPVPEVLDLLEPFVFEWTANVGGSISAEHGVGVQKVPYLHLNKSQVALALMKQTKDMLDPNGILNPYKVLEA